MLFQNQGTAEPKHRHADQQIESPPGDGLCEQRGQKTRPVTERKEPSKARANSSCAKNPSSLFSLAGQRTEKDYSIQKNERIEEAKRETGREGSTER